MKLFRYLAFFVFIPFTFINCAFSEEVVFHSDGKIDLTYLFDSGFLNRSDSLKEILAKDSTYSITSFLNTIDKKTLKDVEQIKVQLSNDGKNYLKIFGTFDNASSLNKSLESLKQLRGKKKDTLKVKNLFEDFDKSLALENLHSLPGFKIEWNGNKLKRTFLSSENKNKDKLYLATLSGGGKYKMKYTFPKPIKFVNDSTALFSLDRKTIFIEYSISETIKSPEKLTLEVELEK